MYMKKEGLSKNFCDIQLLLYNIQKNLKINQVPSFQASALLYSTRPHFIQKKKMI